MVTRNLPDLDVHLTNEGCQSVTDLIRLDLRAPAGAGGDRVSGRVAMKEKGQSPASVELRYEDHSIE